MSRLAILGFCLLAAVSVFGQNAPAIAETGASFRYQAKIADLSKVNYQEFSLLVDGKPIQLHRGSFKKFAHGKGGMEVELFNAWILPSPNGSSNQVLIYFTQTLIGGSSAQTAYIQLLSIENAHLAITQEFRFIPIDSLRACDFDPIKGELRIIAKSADDSPASAPASADHALFRLNGGRFIRTGWQTVSTKLP